MVTNFSEAPAEAGTASPSLSVVLPIYNQERYLGAAVKSILNQTYRDFELVIVDDGSTDATPNILATINDPRLRVIRNQHLGFIEALRKGIDHARAPWIARMDSDDLSASSRLATQMAFLANHPEYVFVGSVFGIVTPNDRFLEPVEQFDWRPLESADITFARVSFADPSTIFSKRIALECGLYDQAFPGNEKPLWYKMLSRGRGAVIGRPLHYVRWRLGSLSRSDMSKGWLDNRTIRERYDPDNVGMLAQKHAPTAQRAKLNAAIRCQQYYLLAGDAGAARQVAAEAVRAAPTSREAWKMIVRGRLMRPTLRRSKPVERPMRYVAVAQPGEIL
jgi:glycosyltransferase involved in cell wall biosynthesis